MLNNCQCCNCLKDSQSGCLQNWNSRILYRTCTFLHGPDLVDDGIWESLCKHQISLSIIKLDSQ